MPENTKKMQTVGDLGRVMYSHPDVGMALQIQDAIRGLREAGRISSDLPLSQNTLAMIREKLYDQNRQKNVDPLAVFFGALASAQSGHNPNAVESALQYIEKLMRG